METIARTPVQLGDYLRHRRRQLGLSQQELAAKISAQQRTISLLETSARVRMTTVLSALAALDLEMVVRPRTKSSAQDIEALF